MSLDAENAERALQVVRLAFGKPCWNAMASQRTDWVVVLDLGEKRRRSMRLANPRLSFLQRTFEGEYSFLIECVWRLDGPSGVVASCFDENHPGGSMHKGLAELEGLVLEDAAIVHGALDLSLQFKGGYVMRCLSTEVDPLRKRNNWSLWSPEGLVTIGPRGRLTIETSKEAEARHGAFKRSLAQEEDEVSSRFGRKQLREPEETADLEEPYDEEDAGQDGEE